MLNSLRSGIDDDFRRFRLPMNTTRSHGKPFCRYTAFGSSLSATSRPSLFGRQPSESLQFSPARRRLCCHVQDGLEAFVAYLGSCSGLGSIFCLGGLAECLALVAKGWMCDGLGAANDDYLARNYRMQRDIQPLQLVRQR